MKTKISHAKVISLDNLTLKQKIEKVLEWTELEYCNFQFEMGLRFLDLELEGNTKLTKKIAQTRLFWAWWINHWAIREKMFFNRKIVIVSDAIYKSLNDPFKPSFSKSNAHLHTSFKILFIS